MRSLLRHLTTFLLLAMPLLAGAGGCTAIAEAVDCDQMCTTLQNCVNSDMEIGRCEDHCEARVDNHALRERLDECTDCLDREYACGEISDRCPVCQDVADEIWSESFSASED